METCQTCLARWTGRTELPNVPSTTQNAQFISIHINHSVISLSGQMPHVINQSKSIKEAGWLGL